MRFSTIIYAAAFSTVAFAQNNQQEDNQGGNDQGGNQDNNDGNAGGDAGLTLDADNVATGSQNDGGDGGVAADGQALSATSDNNFINFCSGKTLTNGLQVEGGSCNGIPMGDIPSKNNMISAVITFPETGGDVAADEDFDITVQIQNLNAGSFTNAQETYYSAPQALQGGNIVGHTHVTVQDMGDNLNPTQPLDPTLFAFFKGINDDGNGNGLLSATVTGGLAAGNYRVCSMTSASNHQPVLMPVAQRGAQDDCTKFTVGAGNGGGNGGNNDGNNDNAGGDNAGGDNAGGDNAGDDNAGNNDGGDGAAVSSAADGGAAATSAADGGAAATSVADGGAASTTAAAGAAETSAAGGDASAGQGQGGRGRGRGGRGRGRGRKQRARGEFIQ